MTTSPFRTSLVLFLLAALASIAPAQDTKPEPDAQNVAKAEEVLKRATEAVGGTSYLNVRTVTGRGFFTIFRDGVSQLPARFLDYISFPDKERTEFSGGGIKTIQTNSGDTGWLYDGGTKSINDMKPEQIDDFKRGMRTSVENLLHGWWRKENAKLSYIGRREAGLAKRNEVVRITYPDGFWIEYEFGSRDYLPSKVIYKRSRKKADSQEMEEFTEEDRLQKPITVEGVTAPWVIDHYIDGNQTSRINYESIDYNQPLADVLFIKPANVKALK